MAERLFDNLLVERRDRVAVVTVNRPDKLNALNAATIEDLDSAFQRLGKDPEVAGIVLTGAGSRAFVAGADIGEIPAGDPAAGKALARRGQSVFQGIEGLGKPVVAAVNGFALGGGCELALACHVRIASENAKLGTPEAKLGLMCGYGGTQRLPRLVGSGRALEMLLTGEPVDAREALRIGLVNRVVPPESLMAEAEGLLRRMIANAPLSLSLILEAVRGGAALPLPAATAYEASLFGELCATDDMREGTRAFLEKREARFRGR
jgi:enoyl-CoA hydratase